MIETREQAIERILNKRGLRKKDFMCSMSELLARHVELTVGAALREAMQAERERVAEKVRLVRDSYSTLKLTDYAIGAGAVLVAIEGEE